MLGRLARVLGPDLGRRAGEDHSLCLKPTQGGQGQHEHVSSQSVCCRQQCLVVDPREVLKDKSLSMGDSGHLRIYLGTAKSQVGFRS